MMFRAVICLVTSVTAMTLTRRDVSPDAISVVNLAVDRGESQHGASGVLYGLPLDLNQIPDKWFIDMGYGYSRGGGSSLTAGGHAWITSFDDYKVGNVRFCCTSTYHVPQERALTTTGPHEWRYIQLPNRTQVQWHIHHHDE